MLDELNKYAPREGSSPIKEVLLDIAERGRSLGIILIGAQQTASEVERRIVSNSSIKVVGRLDPAEAGRPEYGFPPPSQRARAVPAKPGTMFVSQPEIPVPLAVEFPFPAWATRERDGRPAGRRRSAQRCGPRPVRPAAGRRRRHPVLAARCRFGRVLGCNHRPARRRASSRFPNEVSMEIGLHVANFTRPGGLARSRSSSPASSPPPRTSG